MSDTPRTDDIEERCNDFDHDGTRYKVTLGHARGLERELAREVEAQGALCAVIRELREALNDAEGICRQHGYHDAADEIGALSLNPSQQRCTTQQNP